MGRSYPTETDGIRSTARALTGGYVDGCPWRAFSDPFVRRVTSAFRASKAGHLSLIAPTMSNRLVEGLGYYTLANDIALGHQADMRAQSGGKS